MVQAINTLRVSCAIKSFHRNKNIFPSGIVASICNNFQIPHFVGHWAPEDEMPTIENVHMYTRNFFAESNIYSRALAEIIVNFGWKSFTILYDNNDGKCAPKFIDRKHPESL